MRRSGMEEAGREEGGEKVLYGIRLEAMGNSWTSEDGGRE